MVDDNIKHIMRTHFDLEILIRRKERATIVAQIERAKKLKNDLTALAATIERTSQNAVRTSSINQLKVESVLPFMDSRLIHESQPQLEKGIEQQYQSQQRNRLENQKDEEPKDKELLAVRDDGVTVRIRCPNCFRSDFASVHGFISHCRNGHKRKFPSIMVAVRLCGIPLDETNVASADSSSTSNSTSNQPTNRIIESTVPTIFDAPSKVLRESDLKKGEAEGFAKKVTRIRVYDTGEQLEISASHSNETFSTHSGQKRQAIRFLDLNFEKGLLEPQYASDDEKNSMDVDVAEPLIPENIPTKNLAVNENPSVETKQLLSSVISNEQSETRFLIKKRVVIGNISKYIPFERRKLEKFEFKWMIYVQGPPSDPDITPFVSRVRFHLHPDYKPNDVIDVNSAPFQVTRYGWGEFPIRVRLYFVDSKNKSIDIMYTLKLDMNLSGQQVLGGETWTDVHLDKNTEFFEPSGIVATSATSSKWVPSSIAANPTPVGSGGFGRSRARWSQLKGKASNPTKSQFRNVTVSEASVTEERRQKNQQHIGNIVKGDGGVKMEVIIGEGVEKTENFQLDSAISNLLAASIDEFPITGKTCDLEYLTAESTKLFLELDDEERNILESGRASALLRFLQSQQVLNSNHPIFSLSTADVAKWCRLTGHTPLLSSIQKNDSNELVQLPKLSYCKFCGRRHLKNNESGSHDQRDVIAAQCMSQLQPALIGVSGVSSLSIAEPLIESVKSLKQGKPRPQNSTNSEVDFIRQLILKASMRASSNDLVFIWSTVAQIGIPIPETDEEYEVSIHQQEIIADAENTNAIKTLAREVVGGLIYEVSLPYTLNRLSTHSPNKAMRVFVKKLIKSSENIYREQEEEAPTQGSKGILVPMHIRAAVLREPTFDFLTFRFLGT
ncbi:YEATS domain-containing protein 2 [Physocladia obscura]|uniref:YEATS domain-containing protein 2 n=1 Tax=Physocladia obscura TaxID=109957 RepID=A0AAD5T7K3_9FUNG|nr:YEATS domain-containing protein 2 [Physocladia obscura]